MADFLWTHVWPIAFIVIQLVMVATIIAFPSLVADSLGRKLELVIRDDAANVDQGLKHAEEMQAKLAAAGDRAAVEALDVILRSASGYMAAARTELAVGVIERSRAIQHAVDIFDFAAFIE